MRKDGELLNSYASGGDDAAFAEIVRRHGDMVLAACRRVVGSASADDAAQATFMLLAHKAGSLSDRDSVAGWLLTSARFVAQAQLRSETRRTRREREVVAMQEERRADSRIVGKLRGCLDAALESLPGRYRDAVVLYYLEGQSRSEVGAALGLSPEGVSMRLRRALEGLRHKLAHVAGCSVSAAALTSLLAAEKAAGVGGAAVVLSAIKSAGGIAALSASTGKAGALTKVATATFWAKAKLAAAALCAVTAAAGAVTTGRVFSAPEALAANSGGKTVMDMRTMLRFHLTIRKVPNVSPKYRRKEDRRELKGIEHDPQNAPAPANWAATDFDDAHWPRTMPRWLDRSTYIRTSIMNLRAGFVVKDPAAVKDLSLTLGYRGGAVVYLNGKEVARSHLPKGELKLDTEAEAYPDEVWVSAKGGPLTGGTKGVKGEDKQRMAKQRRSLGPVKIPTSALRKGVNVLAIELRRAPYHNIAQQWFKHSKGRGRHYYTIWKPIGLTDLRLEAVGSGIEVNLPRPAGIQVWTPDIHDRLSALDYGDPTKKPKIRIVGARNGSFCGQIALGSNKAFGGVKAAAGDLTGAGKIPAANVKILYGAFNRESRGIPYSDGLLEKPPATVPVRNHSVLVSKKGPKTYKKIPQGATQLVFVRVEVPKDAKPGDYKGTVTVSADGLAAVKVSLELHVSDWTLPDSQNFRTFISLYQSPTSVALQYKVKMWSDEHWKLLEKSWKLLGRAGNKIANVHAIEQTQFGNDKAMIKFVQNGAKNYKHDFSLFDRYVKLAQKHCGDLEHVGVQLLISRSMTARPADQECKVTVKAKDGSLKSVQVPVMGTAESKAFWKPLIHEANARLGKMGMPESLVLGSFSDDTGLKAVNKAFDEIWPGGGPAKWWRGGHIPAARSGKPYPAAGGSGLIVFHEHCYGMMPVSPVDGMPPIWGYRAGKNPGVAFFRDSSVKYMPLLGMRVEVLRGLACRKRGMGRMGLDFWRVLGHKKLKGKKVWVYNRYPNSYVAARCPYQGALSWPSPDGAAPTVRFEAYIEGIQECEALMVINEAIHKHSAKVGPALAKRCKDMQREMLWRMEKAWDYCDFNNSDNYGTTIHFQGNHSGWQATTRKLYDLAAEVSKKLGN